MDIDAAWKAFLDALENHDDEQAIESADNIIAWMRKGGFMPKIQFHELEYVIATLTDLLRK